MPPSLVVENLSKSFAASSVLKGVNFTLQAGEVVLLSGANGIGKSTLLSCLGGLLGVSSGAIELTGVGKVATAAYQKSVGYAGDSLLLYEQLSVQENLSFWARIYGAAYADVEKLSQLFMLQQFLDKPLKHCSLGMRRRVALARSLLHSPKLVCWDEPFVGIDKQRKGILQQVIADHTQQGTMFIVSSHEDVLLELPTKRAVLANGVLEGVGVA